MIKQRTSGVRMAILVVQSGLSVAVLFGTGRLVFTYLTGATVLQWELFYNYSVVLVLGLVVEALTRRRSVMPIQMAERGFLEPHSITVRQVCYAVGGLLVYLAALKDIYISRRLLLTYVPSLYLCLLASNYLLPRMLLAGLLRAGREERTLLIGSWAQAAYLKTWMKRKEAVGLKVVGILNQENERFSGLPRLGSTVDVKSVIREHRVTQVLLLALPENANVHRYLVQILERLGVRLLIVSNLEEKLHHRVVHFEDDGFHFISLREEPLENPLNQLLKRTLDVAVALPVVVLALPVLAVGVWLIQRVQSPGPLFFRQTRAGIQNREFEILKFRSMHVHVEDEGRQASREDSRVYGFGRWMRRFSIDEMPQFWNVLKGDMSVVGPRPHLPTHNTLFAVEMANYHVRTFVKPGITGLAQVRGFRGEVVSVAQIAHRLESDIAYLETWSLTLDVVIILRTLVQMWRPPKTAY